MPPSCGPGDDRRWCPCAERSCTATSGVTGRYEATGCSRLRAGITGYSGHFVLERTGCDRLRPATHPAQPVWYMCGRCGACCDNGAPRSVIRTRIRRTGRGSAHARGPRWWPFTPPGRPLTVLLNGNKCNPLLARDVFRSWFGSRSGAVVPLSGSRFLQFTRAREYQIAPDLTTDGGGRSARH